MHPSIFLFIFVNCALNCHSTDATHHHGRVTRVHQSRNSNSTRTVMADSSLALGVVNTHILTIFDYHGAQVYIYGALSNENDNIGSPEKWIFYYVPIMALTTLSANHPWISLVNNEVRLKLMLGNDEVQYLARKAILNKFDPSKAIYSKFWTVAPLMIDSLTAIIVDVTQSPVTGVFPYRVIHPNALTMTFRFQCSSRETAHAVVSEIQNGDYEIEVAFYFAGFKQVTTSFVSITGEQLRNVLSKTTADGGNSNASYIHRNQAGKFIGNYLTNVKKMIYTENTNMNSQSLINGLEEQFISLLQ